MKFVKFESEKRNKCLHLVPRLIVKSYYTRGRKFVLIKEVLFCERYVSLSLRNYKSETKNKNVILKCYINVEYTVCT